jgi:hypothetical protein
LSIGEDKITRNAAKALFDKHPNTSVLVTLDEQGELVFPEGKAFTPDSSVRVNIVGHSEALEQVGATKLADYTDQLVQHYKIDSLDTHAYLNRAALVGCKNQALSENYAKQLYTLESGVNTLPFGKTNCPCLSSVAITLVSGCFLNSASAASLVTLSSPMDKIMLYLFLPLLFRFKAL